MNAREFGISDLDLVEVASATGPLRVVARVTSAIRPGAVSLSHAWMGADVDAVNA
jgi:anaerobic selenocysteine-containing dehydrogenase